MSSEIMDEEDNFNELQKEVKYLRHLCEQLELQNKILRKRHEPTSQTEEAEPEVEASG